MAWGWDQSSQLGDGAPQLDQPGPVVVGGLRGGSPIVAVAAAGGGYSLALHADGSVLSWGTNASGELGDGGAEDEQATPVLVTGLGPGSGIVAVSAGSYHNLALRADGSVLSWGGNRAGELGRGDTGTHQPTPVAVTGLGPGSGVVAVSAGGNHSLALRSDGSVLSWGNDHFGELGNGLVALAAGENQPTPAPVVGLGAGSGVVAIDAGGNHSLALRADGSVVAWGADHFGQLGVGGSRTGGRAVPVPVSGLGAGGGVVAVSAGISHSLALRSDGSVLAWGADISGELGTVADNKTEPRPVAVDELGPGSGVVAVAAGGPHSLALRSDGSVLSWGNDEKGQLGDGAPHENRATPTTVTGLGPGSGAVAVAAGFRHSLVAKT